ncbi:MAG: cation:proton antiporter [Phycisphaerales bacterium]
MDWSLVLGMDTHSSFALDLLVVLAAAALVSMFVRRMRLATIPGYLIAGAIIGPYGLVAGVQALGAPPTGTIMTIVQALSVAEGENIEQIKQLAVVLLMFTIGLHLDMGSLSTGLVHILAVGLVSTLGVISLGWPLAMVLGASPPGGLAIAMAMAMSSTAVVLRLLAQKRETHRLHGRVCVGVAIVQDLVALAALASLPLLARWAGSAGAEAGSGGEMEGAGLWGLVVGAVLALLSIALLIIFGRYALPPLLREAAREPTGESMLVLSAAIALGAALLTASRGFSPELGAFLAGFLLSSTPFRYHLAGQLSPLRDLFMAVFFTAVGLKLDVAVLKSAWVAILVGLPALVMIKAVLIGLATWSAGATAPVAGRAGMALANSGEFSIVILGLATLQGVTSADEQTIAITLVVLSLMITPTLYDLGDRLQPWLAPIRPARWTRASRPGAKAAPLREAGDGAEAPATDGAAGTAASDLNAPATRESAPVARGHGRAIIAGYGVVGRAVADHLEVNGVPFTIVELNARTVETQERLGRPVVFGDIGNPEVLEKAGIRSADAVFLTVPDDDAVMRACQAIRALAPHVFIAARTTYLSTAFRASAAGADDVTTSEVATAEAMAKRVIARIKSRQPAART